MLIEIDESLLDCIENNDKNSKKAIEILRELASTIRKKRHIVIANRKVLNRITKLSNIDSTSKGFYFQLLERCMSEYKQMKNRFIFYVKIWDYIDNNIYIEKNQRQTIFNISIDYIAEEYEEFYKPTLVAENLDDIQFYTAMVNKYIEETKSNYCKINFKNISGGGNETSRSYEDCINGHGFVLCMLDSDKKTEQDSIGQTARNVVNIYERRKNNIVSNIYVLNVREIENLISPSLYRISNKDNVKVLDNLVDSENDCLSRNYKCKKEDKECELIKFLKYSDIKDGIELKNFIEIKADKKCMFKCYENLINKEILELYPNILDLTVLNEFDKSNRSKKVVLGVGSNEKMRFKEQILEGKINDVLKQKKDALKNIISKGQQNDNLKLEIQILENNINKLNKEGLFNNVPIYLKEEWIDICEILLAWGCAHNVHFA